MMLRFYKLPTRNKFHFGRETNTMWRIKRASLSGSREISRQGLMMSWGLVYLVKITRGATTSRSRSLEKFEVFKWERNTFSLTYRAKFPQIWSPAGKLTTRDVIFQLSFVQPSLKPVKAGTFSFFQFKNLIVAQYSCKGNNTHVSISIEFPGYGVKCILFVGDVLFSSTQLRTLIYDHQILSNAEKSW